MRRFFPHGLTLAAVLLCLTLPVRAERDGVAVIIGNRDYREGIPEVTFALNDAAAMKRFVVEVLGYNEKKVLVLNNATQAELFSMFGSVDHPHGKLWSWVPSRSTEVVVYYSGHGVPGLADGRGYLLPVDADPDTPQINGYPLDLLYRNLTELGVRSIFVYLEACFSGESAGGTLCRNCSGLVVEPRIDEVPKGITVFSAASASQVASWDEEVGHGLFTHYLLQGLYGKADKNDDKTVRLGELRRWLKEEMTHAARWRFRRVQEPTVKGGASKIMARLKEKPRPVYDAKE